MDEWLIIYDGYSAPDLATEVTWLKAQLGNPYGTQTEGNRSYARSTAEFRTRLAAAQQIQKSRSTTTPRHGVADFSQVRP